jgi:hypothetical protein
VDSELKQFAGILAGGLASAEFVIYIVSIIRGDTKPSRATWLILAGVTTMLWIGYDEVGGGHALWVTIAYALATYIVAGLSFWRGDKKWQKEDRYCLAAAGLALLSFAVTSSPVVLLMAAIFADGLGMGITIAKTYHRPHEESRTAWVFGAAANAVNLLAIDQWNNFLHYAYPIYMLLAVGSVAVLTFRKPQQKESRDDTVG